MLGFLGRALSFELSAVQQYLSLARLLQLRGMTEVGQRLRQEAQDEMEHADRIIGRMLALGVAPNASQLRPPRLDGCVTDVLQHAARLEHDIISLYTQAVEYCARRQDHENRLFFDTLLQEERQHAGAIDQWQQSLTAGEWGRDTKT
ncbi:bacterioferritin [Candidatus Tenderia electrophaga]|uniref:Bacterioferritin n=1 Tax=Candidatus Tenderia electrophaga TaxID=1748243 RepID=A0A0S2THX4_9GAMM|nr:bacterioferritin [Candidatus Tenderia electrophaga]